MKQRLLFKTSQVAGIEVKSVRFTSLNDENKEREMNEDGWYRSSTRPTKILNRRNEVVGFSVEFYKGEKPEGGFNPFGIGRTLVSFDSGSEQRYKTHRQERQDRKKAALNPRK